MIATDDFRAGRNKRTRQPESTDSEFAEAVGAAVLG